ncbi:MAG: terpene cyclase/mutase family protein [Planctomycetota bacterium]|nr:terpene cyclase/mutase family protein [Planctomycetota bacterium]
MAGQQQYYEEPADQEYYGQEEVPAGSTGEDLTALASVPWVAIALAVHVILLVIAWFIIPAVPERVQVEVIQAQQEQIAEPPPPEQPPEKPVEFPKDEPEQVDPTEDERIVEDAKDDLNEDPSDKPNNDLAENPNDDPSDNESPHPNRDSTTSAVGLGGGVGGGGGRGGAGGFAHRRARGGGGRPHDDRVRGALEWLKDHQNREGYWSATTFSDDSTRTGAKKTYNIEFVDPGSATSDKGWEATCDIGLTGMALLAFVGAGYDHKEGDYRATCRQAILYLRKVQDNDGCFGAKEDDHFVYNHAICAMAMAEAYGLSGDQVLKPIADKAVEFILKAQNPGFGWRYGVQPTYNDSSVSGWMVLALKSCKMAGLEFDTTKCYNDAAEWFKLVTVDVNGYPKTGYDTPGSNNARLRSSREYDNNPSMDSIYVMSMLFMGKADLNDKNIKSLSRVCIEKDYLPVWEKNKIDYYYWYYASLALYQVGGATWKSWEKSMSSVLLNSQRGYCEADKKAGLVSKEALDEHGSWDAVDAWGSAGGRVYSTAINCLTLEVYYRYLRLEEGH